MKRSIVIFLILLNHFNCIHAQNDTIRQWFPQKLGEAEWSPLVGLDARRSWYSGNHIKINGYRAGAKYKGIHKFGLGYYHLAGNGLYDNIDVGMPDEAEPVIVQYRINAIAAFYERTIFKSKQWELSVPLMFSYGQIIGRYLNDSGFFAEYMKRPYSAIHTGIDARYFILPWLAPRIHLGYRLTFNTSLEVKKTFDRFYYAYGITVLPFELKNWIEDRKAKKSKP